MRKLILRNGQSPGDIVMLTAAVREGHVFPRLARQQAACAESIPALDWDAVV